MAGLSAPSAGHLLDVSVLIEHFAAATAAHCAGRREAGFMAEARPNDNPAQALMASAECLSVAVGARTLKTGGAMAPEPYLGASTITT